MAIVRNCVYSKASQHVRAWIEEHRNSTSREMAATTLSSRTGCTTVPRKTATDCNQVTDGIWYHTATLISPSATLATQKVTFCHQVPRLHRQKKVAANKCHARHTKWHWMSASTTPATQNARRCRQAQRLPQSEGRCRQVPRLPHKVQVDVAKCHACHTNSRGDNGTKREPSTPPERAQCHKCHACHTKWRSMSPSATPATQSAGRCRQVPRLPHKQPRRQLRQTRTKRSPVP